MFSRLDFLIPTVFLTIAGTLGTVFFFLKKEDKDISVKVFILYTVSSLLLSGLLGLTGLISIQEPITMFLLLQGAFLLFGALHAFSLYKLNSWSTQESFWHEFVFTLYIAIVGALAFVVVFAFTNHQGYTLAFATSLILFLIPFLVLKCYDLMLMIPDELYPKWYFPIGQGEIEIPDELLDDSSIVIVEFRMLQSNLPDAELIKSRSKLPLKLELARFFPVFLEQYNDRNAGTQIEFLDENKQPYGWNFYIEPKWWQFKKYINPEITIRENGIKENFIIIAERVE